MPPTVETQQGSADDDQSHPAGPIAISLPASPAADIAPAAPAPTIPPAVPFLLRERAERAMRYAVPVATGLVAVGVVLRFVCTSQLWLDETLSVNISRLPLGQIPNALRHDGSPPLYYVLLHYWMLVFGEGDLAVRALSGLISVGTLPLAWAAGKRLGGRRMAWAALLLLASSPFALNYATTTRMYSLMILWSLLGFLVLARALERPTTQRLVAVGALTAAVLYTHYWGIYLVCVTGLWLLLRAKWTRLPVAAGDRAASWSCFAAMFFGSLSFVPWAPSFIFQTLHTGTPWSNAAGLGDILTVLNQYAGGGPWGAALALTLFTLVLLGIFAEASEGSRVLLNLNVRRKARPVAFVFMGTLTLAVVGGTIAQSAFVGRYTAVVFPLFILLAGLGATVIPDRRVLVAILAWTVSAGLIVGIGANLSPRTQAGTVAAVINKNASPNDVVVYCPDQLGPAVSRLVHVQVQQYTFPRADSPERINWVNYERVIRATNVEQFADQMLSDAAGHDIWFVENPNYPGTENKCSQLLNWLTTKRPNSQLWVSDNSTISLENESLIRFPE